MAKKSKGVNPALETAIETLLAQVMADSTSTLMDKCRVMDRAINIEKLKLKISDDEWGAGFLNPDDEKDE